MTAKIAEIHASTSQVDQFAVVTPRQRLGTWSICHLTGGGHEASLLFSKQRA